MRNWWLLITLIIITIAGILFFNRQTDKVNDDGKPVVKIGVILPLSGDNAEIGNNVKNVILSYVNEVKTNTKVSYEVIVEDDAFKSRNVAIVANKLASHDKVNGIVTILAYAGLVVSPVAENSGISHINIGSNPNVADGVFNFINYTPLEALEEKFSELIRKDNVKTIALVNMDHVGPATYNGNIKSAMDKNNVAYKEYYFQPTEQDFRMMLSEIKKNNPDLIVLMALPPSLDIFAKQFRQAKIEIPITSLACISMSNNKVLFEGEVFVDAPDGSEEFVKKILNEKRIENLFLLAFAQDTIKIYIDTVEKFYNDYGKLPNNEELAELIRNLKDFEGEVGTYSMGKDGVTQSKAVFKKIVNGKPVMVE